MLDTLAQSGTTATADKYAVINGTGSDLTDHKLISGRAERKMITQHICLNLIKVAEQKQDKEMRKAAWNAYHCQDAITTNDGRAFSKYCKSRFCTVCLANRKASIIHAYLPELRTWSNPHFVTLTIKSCKAPQLQKHISQGMIRGWKILLSRLKTRHRRGGKKIIGIKSLECCFNPDMKTYNPHFHLIVPDAETAEIIIAEWLELWTSKYALRCAQNSKPIRNLERGLIEVVKYGTKIFTEDKPNRMKRGKKQRTQLYARALYNIMKAYQKHRLFERFGFNMKRNIKTKPTAKLVAAFQSWQYSLQQRDWIECTSGERLTDFIPPDNLLEQLLRVDLDLQ